MKTLPQREIIIEYFKKHPNRNIKHPEVVDWATAEYEKRTGKKFRDPDREIRKLSQEGQLIKISKGVYRYDPKAVKKRDLEDFTPAQKSQILKRDGYKCVICGRGLEDGVELQVDHIKPKDLGGMPQLQTDKLCVQCIILERRTTAKLKLVKRCLLDYMMKLSR